MLKREKNNKICVYLDTNIIRNIFPRKNTHDILFLNHLKENSILCKTSIFTLLELFEAAKDREYLVNQVVKEWVEVNTFLGERQKKNLNEYDLSSVSSQVNNIFLEYSNIELCNISLNDHWQLVKQICEESNLHHSDIIHLVTAYVNNCTHIITKDGFFISEGNKILKNQGVPKTELTICLPDIKIISNTIKK